MTSEDGSINYRIEYAPGFWDDLKDLLDTRYRRDEVGKSECKDTLTSLLEALRITPKPSGSAPEPWPAHCHTPPWELHKIRFNLPRCSGSARHGRLIYAYNPDTQAIWLVIVYTHAEFKGRPSDKTLKALIQAVIEIEQQKH